MRNAGRRASRVFVLLCLLLLGATDVLAASNPCVEDPGGIGGTGALPGDPVRGGTDPGGVGGSGITAETEGVGGTGIVGTITGFGSICALGIEIHYDAQTRIEVERAISPVGDLAIGQVVAVQASGTGDSVRAQKIIPLYEVGGPVSSVDLGARRVAIMGRQVDVSRVQALDDGTAAGLPLSRLRAGESVLVSGLRRPDGTVDASRLVRGRSNVATVTGRLRRPANGSQPTIEGVPVNLPRSADAADDSEVRVTGKWSSGVLRVSSISASPLRPLFASVTRVELQGYAYVAAPAGSLSMWGQRLRLDQNTQYAGGEGVPAAGTRIRVSARIAADRQFVIERIAAEGPIATRSGKGGTKPANASSGPASGQAQEDASRTGTAPGDSNDTTVSSKELKSVEAGNNDKVEKTDKPKADKAVEKVERASAPDKPAKPDKVDRPDKVDKPGRGDLPERPVRPDKVDRPEKLDKPSRLEKPDKPLKAERK